MKIRVIDEFTIRQIREAEIEVPNDWDLNNLTDEQYEEILELTSDQHGLTDCVTDEFVDDVRVSKIEKIADK